MNSKIIVTKCSSQGKFWIKIFYWIFDCNILKDFINELLTISWQQQQRKTVDDIYTFFVLIFSSNNTNKILLLRNGKHNLQRCYRGDVLLNKSYSLVEGRNFGSWKNPLSIDAVLYHCVATHGGTLSSLTAVLCEIKLLLMLRIVQMLSIITGKNHPQIKLQCLQKVLIWTSGSLVH